jgi:hypothetical protein
MGKTPFAVQLNNNNNNNNVSLKLECETDESRNIAYL